MSTLNCFAPVAIDTGPNTVSKPVLGRIRIVPGSFGLREILAKAIECLGEARLPRPRVVVKQRIHQEDEMYGFVPDDLRTFLIPQEISDLVKDERQSGRHGRPSIEAQILVVEVVNAFRVSVAE